MWALYARVLVALLLSGTLAAAAADIRQETVRFEAEASSASLSGTIKGYESVDYQLQGRAGQSILVVFKPSNLSAYFNLLPPGSSEALFIGSTTGNRLESPLPMDGIYTIRVYLMRNAARRNEIANYTLAIRVAEEADSMHTAFDKTLELHGIQFRVTSANAGSINTLRIMPAGLEIDNSAIERSIDGAVSGAEVADLNADGSPEIYVYVKSAGSGSYGSLVAYSANRRKSLSEIYLPPLHEIDGAADGYMGHDEFAVLEGVLGHRFPIYRDLDTNAKPTGGMRQLQYRLDPGEAGWMLTVEKMFEY